jgi:hypothetical protein
MAKASSKKKHQSLINGMGRKCSSTGVGGRGRKTKVAMSTMNKSKKRQLKNYRGQGR